MLVKVLLCVCSTACHLQLVLLPSILEELRLMSAPPPSLAPAALPSRPLAWSCRRMPLSVSPSAPQDRREATWPSQVSCSHTHSSLCCSCCAQTGIRPEGEFPFCCIASFFFALGFCCVRKLSTYAQIN